jgi:hypothetical protein
MLVTPNSYAAKRRLGRFSFILACGNSLKQFTSSVVRRYKDAPENISQQRSDPAGTSIPFILFSTYRFTLTSSHFQGRDCQHPARSVVPTPVLSTLVSQFLEDLSFARIVL